MPIELQVPVKASDVDAGSVLSEVVLERLVRDDVDDGTDDRFRVPMDAIQ